MLLSSPLVFALIFVTSEVTRGQDIDWEKLAEDQAWYRENLEDVATSGGGLMALLDLQNLLRGEFYWCGVDNNAPYNNAISSRFPNIDICCREHDMCNVSIERGKCSKDGICNDDSLFPLFGCHCEEMFKKCLSAVMTDEDSADKKERFKAYLMGSLYFTVSPMLLERQCLRPSVFSAPAEWWPSFDPYGAWNGWIKTNLTDIDSGIFF